MFYKNNNKTLYSLLSLSRQKLYFFFYFIPGKTRGNSATNDIYQIEKSTATSRLSSQGGGTALRGLYLELAWK